MAITVREAIFLGNFADADSDESSMAMENPGIYQSSFGSAGDPLRDHQVAITFDDADENALITSDNFSLADTLTYDLGGGPMTVHIDNLTAVSADVTYQNGTSQSYNNVVMFQDTAGNLFLVNSDYAGTNLNTNSGIESINVTSVDSGAYNALIQSALQEFICFQSGTRIGTPGGEVAIEALRIGDLVLTADKGPQPILWIGRSNVKETPENAPIKLCAGSLGANLPLSDLYISRQHRILLGSKIAERMFGVSEILAPARTLLDVNGVSRGWNAKPRVYYHILFAGHEVIWANGCRAESLLLGQQAKDLMGREAWAELTTLLPGAARLPKPQPAREIPKPSRVRGLLARHKRNGKPLLAPIA